MLKFFKELDMMSISLILIGVLIVVYFIQKFTNYTPSLLEGLANREDSDAKKYQFPNAIKNWEASSIKYTDADVSNLNNLSNSIHAELNFKKNRNDYEDVLVDLEDITHSFSMIVTLQMTKLLSEMGEKNNNTEETLQKYLEHVRHVNQLQEFNTNLSKIYSWMSNNENKVTKVSK